MGGFGPGFAADGGPPRKAQKSGLSTVKVLRAGPRSAGDEVYEVLLGGYTKSAAQTARISSLVWPAACMFLMTLPDLESCRGLIRAVVVASSTEAEVSESLASGGSDGDAAVLCTRGVGYHGVFVIHMPYFIPPSRSSEKKHCGLLDKTNALIFIIFAGAKTRRCGTRVAA